VLYLMTKPIWEKGDAGGEWCENECGVFMLRCRKEQSCQIHGNSRKRHKVDFVRRIFTRNLVSHIQNRLSAPFANTTDFSLQLCHTCQGPAACHPLVGVRCNWLPKNRSYFST
jgi:hypothetical protein